VSYTLKCVYIHLLHKPKISYILKRREYILKCKLFWVNSFLKRTSTFTRALLRAKSINNVKGKENDNLTLGYITHLVIRIDSIACLENDPAPQTTLSPSNFSPTAHTFLFPCLSSPIFLPLCHGFPASHEAVL
jgi:hypothetical protein